MNPTWKPKLLCDDVGGKSAASNFDVMKLNIRFNIALVVTTETVYLGFRILGRRSVLFSFLIINLLS